MFDPRKLVKKQPCSKCGKKTPASRAETLRKLIGGSKKQSNANRK